MNEKQNEKFRRHEECQKIIQILQTAQEQLKELDNKLISLKDEQITKYYTAESDDDLAA